MKNYYKILGVDRDAPPSALKVAYRALAQEWHPDKHQDADDTAVAEEKFKEISEAYAVLSDAEKRQNYDATGSPDGRGSLGFRGGGFRTTGDPFDIFRRSGFEGFNFSTGPQRPRPMKGQNIQELVDISLKDALFGTEESCSFNVISACEECGGVGATDFDVCPTCKGVGGATQQQENMIFHQTCGGCDGQGRVPKAQCSPCEGRGIVNQTKKFTVVIPEGIAHGAVLRLVGQGGRGFHGGPQGDVLIQVRVKYPDLKELSEEEQEQLKLLLSK